MEIVKIGLAISCISLGCNFVFNWIFIFGKLGVPALGIRGAAVATVIARCCEFAIAAFYLLKKEQRVRFRIRNFFTRDREMAGNFFQNSLPVIVGDSQWGLVGAVKAMLIGRLGVTMVSANSIADVFLSLAVIFTNGLSAGACVVIGKSCRCRGLPPHPGIFEHHPDPFRLPGRVGLCLCPVHPHAGALPLQRLPGNEGFSRDHADHRRLHPSRHLLSRRLLHWHQPGCR